MKRRSLREMSVKISQYDSDGWRADVRDIEVIACGLVDYGMAVEQQQLDVLESFGNPTEDDELAAGAYLAAVLARVVEGIRQIASHLYEKHGKQNVPVAGPNIVGDIYCVIDFVDGIPDPRTTDYFAPQVGIAVHHKRAKWWAAEVTRLISLVTDLDAGRAPIRVHVVSPPSAPTEHHAPWYAPPPTSDEVEA